MNLFLNDPDDDLSVAEIEIMVAEPACRRRGLGREATRLMMAYGERGHHDGGGLCHMRLGGWG